MEHWELDAREQLRDLVARYNANGDTGRFEQVLDLFAPDAVMEIGDGRTYTGRDESQCPVDLGGVIHNSYLEAARDKRMARVLEPIAAWPDDERLAFEISERHAFSLREAMSFGNGQQIRFFEENPGRKFRGAFIEDREYSIELPISEQFN